MFLNFYLNSKQMFAGLVQIQIKKHEGEHEEIRTIYSRNDTNVLCHTFLSIEQFSCYITKENLMEFGFSTKTHAAAGVLK